MKHSKLKDYMKSKIDRAQGWTATRDLSGSCTFALTMATALALMPQFLQAATVEAESVLDLANVLQPPDGQTAIVKGYFHRGDAGGGEFYWDAASTAATNLGTVLSSSSSPSGRWVRIYSGALNVRWFGAKGDGSQNDAPCIQNALNSIPQTGGALYIPTGNYLLASDPMRLQLADLGNQARSPYNFCLLAYGKQGLRIFGDGPASRLSVARQPGTPYSFSDPSLLALVACTNCSIESIRVSGAAKTYPGRDLRDGSGIVVQGSTGVRVVGCTVDDAANGILIWASSWTKVCQNHVFGYIAQTGIEFYNNGTGDSDHNIVSENSIDGGDASSISMGIRPDCGYCTVANNTLRGIGLESIVLEGRSNRFECISGNTIETRSYYGLELRSCRNSVVLGNIVDGGGLDLKATGLERNPPARVMNNLIANNAVVGGRGDQAVYLSAQRNNDITTHNTVCNNMIETRAGTYGIQLGNARFNKITGNNISRVDIGVVLDAPDTVVDGNAIFTSHHGIYASSLALREFIHGNYLCGSATIGSSPVFLNQSYTDAYVADNEERNFGQADIIASGHSYTFAYSSRYSLVLQPSPTPPNLQPWNSPGTIYMNSSLPGKGILGCDMKGNWHPIW